MARPDPKPISREALESEYGYLFVVVWQPKGSAKMWHMLVHAGDVNSAIRKAMGIGTTGDIWAGRLDAGGLMTESYLESMSHYTYRKAAKADWYLAGLSR